MATFAETMLAKYETLLQTSAGLDSVMVDGQSVRYTDVEAKYRVRTEARGRTVDEWKLKANAVDRRTSRSPCPARRPPR